MQEGGSCPTTAMESRGGRHGNAGNSACPSGGFARREGVGDSHLLVEQLRERAAKRGKEETAAGRRRARESFRRGRALPMRPVLKARIRFS